MLIRQSKFTSTNYVSSFKSNKAWYQLSHSLASAALPLHADVAMVDQAEKPQMPIRHEWVIVSRGGGGWWHKGVCYNVLRHSVFPSFPDIESDTSEFTDRECFFLTHSRTRTNTLKRNDCLTVRKKEDHWKEDFKQLHFYSFW